nr:SAM-dependent chlorinase/fluorinase [Desulfobacula sp.]
MTAMGKGPVVLLTDFGLDDAYAGILKGVAASISPETRTIDLSHGVAPQDILHGAFLLAASFSYFPKGSVFCVVVDPGVGSDRKGICIKTEDYYFVGPDNGILWEAANRNRIKDIIHLTQPAYFLNPVSGTFHGRDIFVPVAAHISKEPGDITRFGNPLESCVKYEFPRIVRNRDTLDLCILHIDRFGNLILNIEHESFIRFVQGREFSLAINGERINKVLSHYAQAGDGEFFLMASSSSHMEISLKNSNAALALQAVRLGRAVLKRSSPP